MRSGWLLRDGDVVCALEMADSRREKAQGLRGRNECPGGMHLVGTRSVHTAGMKFALDVAFLSDDLFVLDLARVEPWRIALRRRGTRSVMAFEAGALERWGVRVGDQFDIREVR
jgi:uncharacterized protein